MVPKSLRTVFGKSRGNARQHTGPGAICAVTWRREDDTAAMRVSDDGHGVSPGNAARILDGFFTIARKSGGTGLGLAIARGHVEAAGGTLRLLHSPQGAVLEIRLRKN